MAKTARAGKSEEFRNQDEITLGVLTAIEHDANLSQRMISTELGVALGLANAYLKRCVGKGWIKIQEAPTRRYAYYLTPKGFSEKARLTGNYLSASFNFFRRAREQMDELVELCVANGWRRIAYAGISELAEVGMLCAQEFDITIVAIIDPYAEQTQFRRLPVISKISKSDHIDAVIVTELSRPQEVCKLIEASVGAEHMLVPRLLKITPRPGISDEKVKQAAG